MNVKKVIAVLASAVMCSSVLASVVSAAAQSLTYNGVTFEVEGTNVTITGCESETASVVIPESYELLGNVYTVKAIGNYAFSGKTQEGCDHITDIALPASVTSVGAYAFYNCDGIRTIELGAGVNSIGQFAFAGTTSLEAINVAEGNTSFSSEGGILYDANGAIVWAPANCNAGLIEASAIGNYAFAGNNSEKIAVLSGIESIGIYAFYDSALKEIALPASVTSIGYSAFPEGTIIAAPAGSYALEYAKENGYTFVALESDYTYNVVNGTAVITGVAGSVTGAVEIPEIIDGYVVSAIGDYAFSGKLQEGNDAITSVSIPASVKSIGNYAFYNCDGIQSIEIGAGVASIGQFAFTGCKALTSFTVDAANTVYTAAEGGLYKGTTLVAAVNEAYFGAFAAGTTEIAPYAFADTTVYSLKTIPASLTTIGRYAFYGSDLVEITVPATVTEIAPFAIPANVTIYGYKNTAAETYATANGNQFVDLDASSSLFTYTIAEGVVTITGISDEAEGVIVVPATIEGLPVVAIADYAFAGKTEEGNDKITSVVLPDSITSIGNYAFEGCEALESVDLGDGVDQLGQFVFNGCSALTSITGGGTANGAIVSGSKLVYVPEAATNYEFPTGITSIGAYAFANNSSDSISIPETIESIGIYAFYGSDITGITVNGKTTAIGYEAIPSATVITGYTGSTAEEYADANGNTFIALDGYLYGDANDDGVVNAFDALYILQYVSYTVDLNDTQLVQANVDGDGAVTVFDAILVLKYNAFMIDQFPVEAE